MALTKLTQDLNIIQKLDPEPNDVQGLTYQELQAKYDEAGNDIKDFINNTLTTEMDTNVTNLTNNIETHKASNDHDVRYYTKGELNPFIQGGGTKQREEVFTIVNANLGDGTFSYSDKAGNTIIGTLSGTGGQIFALNQGSYIQNDNRIEVIINDTLRRSVASGGIIETDTTHVELATPMTVGAEITIKYLEALNLASNAGLVTVTNTLPISPYMNQVIVDTSI